MRWYLDVYAYDACLGTESPVNSYFSNDLAKLTSAVVKMLQNSLSSGIDEVRIRRTSDGEKPIPIEIQEADVLAIRHHDEEFVEGLI